MNDKALLDALGQIPADGDEELLDTRISALEAVVRKHGRDIAALKKANRTSLQNRRRRLFGSVCFCFKKFVNWEIKIYIAIQSRYEVLFK